MRVNAFSMFVCAVVLAAFVSCGDDVLHSEHCVENATEKEILMTDGSGIYTIPASTTVTVSVEYGYDDDVPELSLVNDGYPRVTVSVEYPRKKSRKYTVKSSGFVEYTVINTGNYTVEVSGNYLGEDYGDTVTVGKQSSAVARFYNGDHGFSVRYVDESVGLATPFSATNGNVITVH